MNLKQYLISLPRGIKKVIVLSVDFFAICLSVALALVVNKDPFLTFSSFDQVRLLSIPLLTVLAFWYAGVYSSVIRFIDNSLVLIVSRAVLYSVVLVFLFNTLVIYIWAVYRTIPFSFLLEVKYWLVGIITFSLLILTSRLVANYFFSDRKSENRVLIYGAGSAGIQLASALRVSSEMQPIAFLDSDKALHGTYLGGLKVLSPSKLEKLVRKGKIDEVLIAMPSVSRSTLKNLLKEIEKHPVKVRILPGLAELAQGKVLVSELKEVDIPDLLGRNEVTPNENLLSQSIKGKVVLITGAGGSIGSEISRQVAKNEPKKIILLDSNEYALYSVKQDIEKIVSESKIAAVLASVTNKARLLEIFRAFKIDTIYHAAAYKHVSIVEENPFEAVSNNIIGTKITAEAAIEAKTETFVLISTDKAVRPTNIMGATKRFAELTIQALAEKSSTKMSMVRFGNVIGSSGSAIPLFQEQIKGGGPVTVTHPDVIRYFMSIPEAAELVIQAGSMGNNGDVFVLDMGEPVKIYELAKLLIKLSGMELIDENNPNGDIEIQFTGLKPGEKLYEELLIGNNTSETEHPRILRAQEDYLSEGQISKYLQLIYKSHADNDVLMLKNILKEAITGFSPDEEIVDIIYKQKHT